MRLPTSFCYGKKILNTAVDEQKVKGGRDWSGGGRGGQRGRGRKGRKCQIKRFKLLTRCQELGSKDTHHPDSTPPRANRQVNNVSSRKSPYPTPPTIPAKRRTQQVSPPGPSKKPPSQGLHLKSLEFTESSFGKMIFCTERRNQDKTHVCLATHLVPTDSALPVNPENLDFDFYCGILRNKEILDYSYQLEFTDLKGRRVQITDQMTFRAAILVQVGQNVDMITFHAKPIGKIHLSRSFLMVSRELKLSLAQVVRVPAAPTTPSAAQTHPIDISPSITSFAHTVFGTESLDTGRLHVCLANDFTSLTTPSSSNTVINLTPDTVDYDRYCSLLRKEKMLDDDQTLGFNDGNGRRVPIINQMMFRAAVTYQVSRKADMISFTSSRTTSREREREHGDWDGRMTFRLDIKVIWCKTDCRYGGLSMKSIFLKICVRWPIFFQKKFFCTVGGL